MFKHILLPTDGSSLSLYAITAAIGFAKEIGARVTGVHVSEIYNPLYDDVLLDRPGAPFEYLKRSEEAAGRFLKVITERASAAGIATDVVYVAQQDPYVGIIQTAEQRSCDLIFMASHGRRGLDAVLLGSVTQKVLTHCKVPVLVYRQ